ncbi:hypothetical protein LCGC14_0913490 [marine sediment metagenome]|uniref:Uncharacterized protein n=1 Tax=marine sediment metagenome TaxID=412755 RepID=A0A0F9RBQ2_9ZZZZ
MEAFLQYIILGSFLAGVLVVYGLYVFYKNSVGGKLILVIVGEDNRVYTRIATPDETVVTVLSPKGEEMTYSYDRTVVMYKKHFRFLDQWTPMLLCVEGIPQPIDPRKMTNSNRFGKQLAVLLGGDVTKKFAQSQNKEDDTKKVVAIAVGVLLAAIFGLGYYLVEYAQTPVA